MTHPYTPLTGWVIEHLWLCIVCIWPTPQSLKWLFNGGILTHPWVIKMTDKIMFLTHQFVEIQCNCDAPWVTCVKNDSPHSHFCDWHFRFLTHMWVKFNFAMTHLWLTMPGGVGVGHTIDKCINLKRRISDISGMGFAPRPFGGACPQNNWVR